MFQIKEYKVLFVFRLLYDFSLVVIGVKPFRPQDLADRTFKHQMWKDINSTQKHNLDNSEKWVCCHFEYPILLLSPIIIFRPHVSKIPYHLFTHILLLQHITYPLWSRPNFKHYYEERIKSRPSDRAVFSMSNSTFASATTVLSCLQSANFFSNLTGNYSIYWESTRFSPFSFGDQISGLGLL